MAEPLLELCPKCGTHFTPHRTMGAIRSQERQRLKEAREDAYCVEEFLRKVTAWEGAAEDELAEAIESAEKLTAALDTLEAD